MKDYARLSAWGIHLRRIANAVLCERKESCNRLGARRLSSAIRGFAGDETRGGRVFQAGAPFNRQFFVRALKIDARSELLLRVLWRRLIVPRGLARA